MASATVNGAALAVSYVGNGGGASPHDDSSPDDGGQLSPYEEPPENHDDECHHHHLHLHESSYHRHPSRSLLGEDDDASANVAAKSEFGGSGKRPASVLASTYDAPTPPSSTSAASAYPLSNERSSKKRRKQSNPVRLATTRMCSSDQDVLDYDDGRHEDSLMEGSSPPPRSGNQLVGGSVDLNESIEDEDISLRDGFDGSIYRCSHCNVLFEEEEHLREHIEEEHVQKVLERQLQQQNQKNQCGTIVSSGGNGSATSSLNANPFDLSATSVALRIDGRTPDSSSSEPSMQDFKPDDKASGSLQQPHHHQHTTSSTPVTPGGSTGVTALRSPKEMAGLMALSAFGATPFLIPVLPCASATSAPSATSSRIGPPTSTSSATVTGGAGSTISTTAPPIRIFNPEAYCELCNKEFCNKYFLKTHKANKHGIYSIEVLAGATSAASTTPTASQVASYAGSLVAAAAAASLGGTSVRPLLQGGSAASVLDGAAINGSNGNAALVATSTTGMVAGGMSASSMASMAGLLLGQSVIGKALPVMNPEAFCDICQKEFCNKYFLKKHRQKIHGILDFSAPLSFGGSASSSGSMAVLDAMPATSSSDLSPIGTSLNSTSTIHHSTQPELYYEYGARDLSAKIAAATQGLLPKHSIPSLVAGGATTAANLAAISTVPASHFTSGTGGTGSAADMSVTGSVTIAGHVFSPERLREMGVINVDAFCELCCKEFCNKYFLRTHKLNKHGVGSGDCLAPPPPGTKSTAMSLHQQSTPLCLVMDKESGVDDGRKSTTPNSSSCSSLNGSTNGHGTATEQIRPPSESQDFTQESASVAMDLTCDVCSRPFSSTYLLKMHKFYFHSVDPTSSGNDDSSGVPPGSSDLMSTTCKLPPSSPDAHEVRCASSSSLKSLPETNEALGSVASNATCGSAAPPLNEDLQKLQTMIRELNTSPKDDLVKCSICFREMKNKYFLRAHMMNEHGELHNEDDMSPGDCSLRESGGRESALARSTTTPIPLMASIGSSATNVKASNAAADPESFCDLCGKEFCSKYLLRTHITTAHSIGLSPEKPPDSANIPLPVPLDKIKIEVQGGMAVQPPPIPANITLQVSTPSMPGSERPPMSSVTGRNFCEICNKELCNKYFMKTHMLKMHGINVDEKSGVNGATIGGVTCDICQKELCSKYFLKVHKQNTHGIFEEPTISKESYAAAAAAAAAAAVAAVSMTSAPDKDGGNAFQSWNTGAGDGNTSDGGGGGNRYFSHYTEVCPLCDRRFKSIKWLKTHVINDHADLAKDNGLAELLGTEVFLGSGNSGTELSPHTLRAHHFIPRDYMLGADPTFGIKVEKPSSSSSSATTSPNATSPFHLHSHHPQSQPPSAHRPLSLAGHTAETDASAGGGGTSAVHHAGELGSTGAAAAATGAVASATMAGTSSTSSSSPSSATSTSCTTSAAVSGAGASGFASATRKPLGAGNGTRIYHCSYCSYSTRWLSNLYAHEKRHTGLSSEGEKRFCCRVCHRAYRYNHSLQRHLVSHKTTGILFKHVVSSQSLASPHHLSTSAAAMQQQQQQQSLTTMSAAQHSLSSPTLTASKQQAQYPRSNDDGDDSNNESLNIATKSNNGATRPTTVAQSAKMAPARVKKYRCSKCGAKYRSREQCLEHIHTHHNTRNRHHHHGYHPRDVPATATAAAAASSASKAPLNCPLCPFSCSTRETLASHLAKHQRRDGGGGTVSGNDDNNEEEEEEDRDAGIDGRGEESGSLSPLQQQHLQQAFGRAQLPMTYGVPQTPPAAGSFIMQPFLVSQADGGSDGGAAAVQSLPSNTIVPSLIYLPVTHKVSDMVTVSFNLSPA